MNNFGVLLIVLYFCRQNFVIFLIMIQRLIIDGQPEYIELMPKIENDDSQNNRREWLLENGKIKLKFVEEPLGQFKEFLEIPQNIELDKEVEDELKFQIFDLFDKITEQQRSGFEADAAESNSLEKYPYDPKDIAINNFNWSVDYINQLLKKDIIDLSPDFQRNFVWDYKRRCRLIESILLGIPIPAFYLAKKEGGKGYYVVDGLQRLTTLRQFLNNDFPLKHLEYLNKDQRVEDNVEGKYFRDEQTKKKKGLGDDYEFRLLGTQFNVNVMESQTPIRVKFDVFRRINTGGKPLNNQEIRNCLMDNSQRRLINDLATSDEFQTATGGSVSSARMNAQELVMRFIGFWYLRILKTDKASYQGDMQAFLDDMVDRFSKDAGKYDKIIERDFKQAMNNAFHLFGDYCFRKCLPKHLLAGAKRQLINKSLFTTWSVLLSQIKTVEVRSSFPKQGSFASMLAEALERSKKGNENNFSQKTSEQGAKNVYSYYDTVSYRTNDKVSLEIAFAKTAELIQNYIA